MATPANSLPDIRQVLDPLPIDKSLKAAAWDGFHQSRTPEDFRSVFDALDLPKETKAALWDLRFASPEAMPSPDLTRFPDQGLGLGDADLGGPPPLDTGAQLVTGRTAVGQPVTVAPDTLNIAAFGGMAPPVVRPAMPLPAELATPAVPTVGGPPDVLPIRTQAGLTGPSIAGPIAPEGPPTLEPTRPVVAMRKRSLPVQSTQAGLPPIAEAMGAGLMAQGEALASPEGERVGADVFHRGLAAALPDIQAEFAKLPPQAQAEVVKAVGPVNVAAVGIGQSLIGLLTAPESALVSLVAGEAGPALKMLANSPRVAPLIAKYAPKLLPYLDVVAETAVPGAMAGLGAADTIEGGLQAVQAAREGKVGEALAGGGKALAGAGVAALAGREALRTGREVVNRQPAQVTGRESIGELKRGATEAAVREPEMAEAGHRLTAEQWQQRAQKLAQQAEKRQASLEGLLGKRESPTLLEQYRTDLQGDIATAQGLIKDAPTPEAAAAVQERIDRAKNLLARTEAEISGAPPPLEQPRPGPIDLSTPERPVRTISPPRGGPPEVQEQPQASTPKPGAKPTLVKERPSAEILAEEPAGPPPVEPTATFRPGQRVIARDPYLPDKVVVGTFVKDTARPDKVVVEVGGKNQVWDRGAILAGESPEVQAQDVSGTNVAPSGEITQPVGPPPLTADKVPDNAPTSAAEQPRSPEVPRGTISPEVVSGPPELETEAPKGETKPPSGETPFPPWTPEQAARVEELRAKAGNGPVIGAQSPLTLEEQQEFHDIVTHDGRLTGKPGHKITLPASGSAPSIEGEKPEGGPPPLPLVTTGKQQAAKQEGPVESAPSGVGGENPEMALPSITSEGPPDLAKPSDNIRPESKPAIVDVTPGGPPDTHKFSSTQVNLPEGPAGWIKGAAAKIADEDLAPDGRETEPHVTVRYGLLTEDAEAVRKALEGEGPITLTAGKTSLFPDSGDGEVVKVDVDSPDLHRLNKKIADAIEHTDTHPDYKPHITLAYVKPGTGEKYVGMDDVEGMPVTVDTIRFSTAGGQKFDIRLEGPAKVSPEQRPEAMRPKPPAPEAETPEDAKPLGQVRSAVLGYIQRGETLDNKTLFQIADKAFGGTLAQGKYSPKDAYDAMESAVAQSIAEGTTPLLDPGFALKTLDAALGRLPTQTLRTNEQQAFQQFSTPPTIAYVMAYALNADPSDVVLEPSAGTGMLAAFPKRAGAYVHVNEIAPRRKAILQEMGFDEVTNVNAEHINNIKPGRQPTAIIMNPPFSASAGRLQTNDTNIGARHLEQALLRLAPGGRLVALLGEGMEIGKAKFVDFWKRLAGKYNIRANIGISGDLYRKYGTSFGTQLIVIDKTGPTPGATYQGQLANVKRGAYTDLEEAANALRSIREDRPTPQPEADTRKPGASAGGGVGSGVRSPTPGVRPEQRPVGGPPPLGEPGASVRTPTVSEEKPGPRPGASEAPGAPEPGATPRTGAGGSPEPAGRVEQKGGEEEEEQGVKYATYRKHPDLLDFPDHPADIVESASMGAVDPPRLHYKDSIPAAVHKASERPLSALQMEAIRGAGQRHERFLPGEKRRRAGYFIGHGTGVGKGQILAGIILDNWYKGRKKSLWITKSWDLFEDAKRDIEAIVGKDHPLTRSMRRLDDWSPGDPIDMGDGMVFTTYDTMKSTGKVNKADEGKDEEAQIPKRRTEQLQEWAGENPVIIFDEAHLAKNALVGGNGRPTIVGQQVLALQDNIPGAHVVYSSATGATDVQNMGYMNRMGLWGTGTPFSDFGVFLTEIEGAGLGAKEMLARDMKALGMYVAANLSFKGVTYRELIHDLTPEQEEMYDAGARIWQVVWQNLNEALGVTNAPQHVVTRAKSQMWSSHQRFFRQVTTAMKVPTLIKDVEKQLEAGNSAVIGLIGTGEARTSAVVSRARAEGSDLNDLDFSPKQTLEMFLKRIFPTQEFEEVQDPDDPTKTITVMVTDPDGNPVRNAEMEALRDEMIEALSRINIPDNPLDQIINHFGSDAVAELTGRTNRLITDPKTGRREYVKRKVEGVAQAKTNLAEQKAFQDGKKRILIMSDSANTGFSFHASNRAKNQQRRIHYALELGWSADKQMQSFGRTHRSDQKVAPEYVLMSTNVGGEKRFSSTIARRLGSMGALTRGQRDATGGGQLAKYDFESRYGSAATDSLYGAIEAGQLNAPEFGFGPVDFAQMLGDVGLTDLEDLPNVHVDQDVRTHVPTFLNRMLGLEVKRQNVLFDNFTHGFERAIEHARSRGTFDDGVQDLKAIEVRMKGREVVAEDKLTGAPTYHVEMEADIPTKPVSWDRAVGAATGTSSTTDRFYKDNKKGGYVQAYRTGGTITDAETGRTFDNFGVRGPQREHYNYVRADKFAERYSVISPGDLEYKKLREWWNDQFEKVPAFTTDPVHILAGAVIPLWEHLKAARGHGMRVIRVTTKTGERVVGISIPPSEVRRVLAAIGVARDLVNPQDVFDAVLQQGERVTLINGAALVKVRFRGDEAIELKNHKAGQWQELRNMGLTDIIDQLQHRFFVPTDERGVRIIETLTTKWPPLPPATSASNVAPANTARDVLRDFITSEEGFDDLGVLAERLGQAPEMAKRAWDVTKMSGGVKYDAWFGPNGSARAANWGWHTPRYIGELHPYFAPFVNTAEMAYEERTWRAHRLGEILEPYLTLPSDKRKKLDARLIDARFESHNDIDERGLDAEQLAGFRAVREAMATALNWLADLVVDIASGGLVVSAEGLESLADVEEALEEVEDLKDAQRGPLAEKVWNILQEIRDAAAKGYVPFTRFGDYTYGLYPTKEGLKRNPDLQTRHESRESAAEASARYLHLINIPQYKKLIESGDYEARKPKQRSKDSRELLRELHGFEISIMAKLVEARPEFAQSMGITPEELNTFAESIEKMNQRLGFRAHFIQAKLTPGFERDLMRPFADYVVNLSKHIANAKMFREFSRHMRRIPNGQTKVRAYAKAYVEYLQSAPAEFNAFRGFLFHMFLGVGNPMAAAVNLTQVMMMSVPWMLQYANPAKVGAEVLKAYRDVMGAMQLTQRRINYEALPDDIREAAREALESGTLQAQSAQELHGIARRRSKIVEKAERMSTFLFSGAEHINRLVSFIAMARLFKPAPASETATVRKRLARRTRRYGLPMAYFMSAREFAEHGVRISQLEYARYNKPAVFRGRMGAVLGVFKMFAVGQMELMLRLARPAVFGGAKPPRKPPTAGGTVPPDEPPGGGDREGVETTHARMALFAWIGIMAAAAGILGLPFVDVWVAVAEAGWKLAYKEQPNWHAEWHRFLASMTSREVGDAILHGASWLTPYDLSRSLSMGDPTGFVARTIRTGEVLSSLSAGLAITGRTAEGLGELASGEGGRAIEAAGPRTARGLAQAARMAKEGLRTRAGGKILPKEAFGPPEIAGAAASVPLTKVSKAYEREHEAAILRTGSQGAKGVIVHRAAKEIDETGHLSAETKTALQQYNKTHGDRITNLNIREALRLRKMSPEQRRVRSLPRGQRREFLEGGPPPLE